MLAILLWVLYAVVGLVVVLTVAGVALHAMGKRLPEEHRGHAKIRLHRSAQAVWDAITDFEKYPKWAPGVTGMERLPDHDGLPSYRQTMGRNAFVLTITKFVPPGTGGTALGKRGRFETTIVDDHDGPFGGSWLYTITPEEDLPDDAPESTLEIVEIGRIRPAMPRAIMKYVMGYNAYVKKFLKGVARAFNEPARFE
ncbi:MAG: SRPBCC family protein [Phycisphaeraceae bacterium]|nr:SRPBCC family protein [Phycisphaeraceae bacterium]